MQTPLKKAIEYIGVAFNESRRESINAVLNRSLEALTSSFLSDRAYIFHYSPELDTVSNVYEWAKEGIEPQKDELQDVPFDVFPNWKRTHFAQQSYVINDVAKSQDESEREALLPQGIKSLISSPIYINEEYLGFVGVDYNQTTHVPSEAEVQALELYASVLAMHMQHQTLKVNAFSINAIQNHIENEQITGGWELDVNTKKTFWTPGVYAIYDVPNDFDHNLLEGISRYVGDDQQRVAECLESAMTNHKPFKIKAKLKTAANNIKAVEVTGRYIHDEEKPRVIGSIRNISNIEEIQEVLDTTETNLSYISEIGETAFLLLSDGQYKASKYYASLFNVPLYGKKMVADLTLNMTDEVGNTFANVSSLVDLYTSDHTPQSMGNFLVQTDHKGSLWMEIIVVKHPSKENQASKTLVIFKNIDDLKRKIIEERESTYWLNRSQEVGRVGHFLLDPVSGKYAISPQLERIYELRDVSEKKVVDDWLSMIDHSEREDIRKKWYDFMENGDRFEATYGITTEQEKPLRISLSAIKTTEKKQNWPNSEEEGPIILALVKDVTEDWRKQEEIERQLRILNLAAEKASHELRAIVSRIRGIVTLTQFEKITEDEQKQFFNAIKHESEKLDNQIKSIAKALNKRLR